MTAESNPTLDVVVVTVHFAVGNSLHIMCATIMWLHMCGPHSLFIACAQLRLSG